MVAREDFFNFVDLKRQKSCNVTSISMLGSTKVASQMVSCNFPSLMEKLTFLMFSRTRMFVFIFLTLLKHGQHPFACH